jgi:Flp pilus assembly protein TadB
MDETLLALSRLLREHVSESTLVFAVMAAAGALIAFFGLTSIRRVSLEEEAARVRGIHQPSVMDRLQARLDQAGIELRVTEFLTVAGLLGLVGFAMGVLLGLYALAMVCLVVGPLLYYQFLMSRRERTMRAFREQLADAVDDYAEFYRIAEGANDSAFLRLTEHAPPLLKPAFERIVSLLNNRIRLDAALQMAAQSRSEPFFRQFLDAVATNYSTGGDLAPVLARISQAQRAQLALQNQIRAQQSGGRLVALVYGVAPVGFLVFIRLFGGDLFSSFYTTGGGQLLQIVAVLSGGLAYWAARRVARRGIYVDEFAGSRLDPSEHHIFEDASAQDSLDPRRHATPQPVDGKPDAKASSVVGAVGR